MTDLDHFVNRRNRSFPIECKVSPQSSSYDDYKYRDYGAEETVATPKTHSLRCFSQPVEIFQLSINNSDSDNVRHRYYLWSEICSYISNTNGRQLEKKMAPVVVVKLQPYTYATFRFNWVLQTSQRLGNFRVDLWPPPPSLQHHHHRDHVYDIYEESLRWNHFVIWYETDSDDQADNNISICPLINKMAILAPPHFIRNLIQVRVYLIGYTNIDIISIRETTVSHSSPKQQPFGMHCLITQLLLFNRL